MEIKISTKEKFFVITPTYLILNDNIADEIINLCLSSVNNEVKNIILNFNAIKEITETAAIKILEIQNKFYQVLNSSFVICEVTNCIEKIFEKLEILEQLNITPTESEAWDIVQIEEIERELLNDFDENLN